MTDRVGKRQQQMLAWLLRVGPNAHVGFSTPATDEISGFDLGQATQVLRSLRARGLVHCPPNGRGAVNLTDAGRRLAEIAAREVRARYDAWLSKHIAAEELEEPRHD